jgi:hypothetical protein
MINHLDHKEIVETIDHLTNRIGDRFPQSGLNNVCIELHALASKSSEKIEWISRPNLIIRSSVALTILLALFLTGYSISLFDVQIKSLTLTEIIQLVESTINDLIFLGAAIFFLVTIEIRLKRSRALQALHELRSFAHIVDMHQLTKDPAMVNQTQATTPASPDHIQDIFQLKRYLDYCSEMCALIGKLSALYSQSMPDPVVVGAANDIENLCTGLSRKIWQKIMILSELDNKPER